MSVVSYDSQKMADIAAQYKSAKAYFADIDNNIRQAIETIRANWTGDDADKANIDLVKIETALGNISDNLRNANAVVEDVLSNFGQLKY